MTKAEEMLMRLRVYWLRWRMWWCGKSGGHYFRTISLTSCYESTCMECGYREHKVYAKEE